ncbi:MAG: hypothetical protein M0R80_05970 [Proteobacteria bacterium]|nr:hypothetical protein [Pseudomonadota bacterium]
MGREGSAMLDKEEAVEKLETSAVWHRHQKPPPHPLRAGMIACLRCDTVFLSWDRVLNRLCRSCSHRKG